MKKLGYILLFVIFACQPKESDKQFKLLDNSQIGITFRNDLTFDDKFNVYTYRNYYNGGGVAIGDVNNDGLADIYFTANQGPNQLYLNKGGLTFENISETAGISGERAWSTGVSMVDVNADGLLDIYVCNSGDIEGDNKQNELFINKGDLTFDEQAEKYGLADPGYSTHASFFDYDGDGDLDVYLLNNSYQAIGSFDLRRNERPKRDSLGGDKLLRNEAGRFIDVSEQAGIYGSVIGFGLGVTVGDVDGDFWDDIYISNDFFERDYLYINKQDGTFEEVFTDWVESTSGASMGADMADINNDGKNDLFITEMLPRDPQRLKTVTTFEDWNRYQYGVNNDYYHQFTRNTFQVNHGKGFHELGRFSGVEATDWSWGALMFDMNNDGLRDIYVANGIYQDLTDQDYLRYISNQEVIKSIVADNKVDYKRLVDLIPSNPVPNYAFINQGDLSFSEKGDEIGLGFEGFSNGAAYGDLDNDGDLDLVVNNVNSSALIYENKLTTGNSIAITTKGNPKNPFGYGAKISIKSQGNNYYIEQQPARGFQSSMDQKLIVGLVDDGLLEVQIVWPGGATEVVKSVKPNSVLELSEENAQGKASIEDSAREKTILNEIVSISAMSHEESKFIDFDRDRLLNHMLSTMGPKISSGIMDDKLIVLMGGSKGFNPQIQKIVGSRSDISVFDIEGINSVAENAESVFFDADGDSDLDLYITSGGVEVSQSSSALLDQLYLNNGDDTFVLSDQFLPTPKRKVSSSSVDYSDIDQDGDYDLVVGEFSKPLKYGLSCDGFILINDGKGNFTDKTSELAPELMNIGMISDVQFGDLNGDGNEDLVVTGEYIGVVTFENVNGKFKKNGNLSNLTGWWNGVHLLDIEGDGDLDILAGNHGLNSRFKASSESPIRLYVHDFDYNGFIDPILTKNVEGKFVPYSLRHNLIDQIPSLKKVYPNYVSFRNAHIEEMFGPDILGEAKYLECVSLETSLFVNDGSFNFTKSTLPAEVQFAPIFAISSGDYDHDGDTDILLGGNLYGAKPEVGRYDASSGLLLLNDGNGQFSVNPSGLEIKGEIRDILTLDSMVIIARNNDQALYFSY